MKEIPAGYVEVSPGEYERPKRGRGEITRPSLSEKLPIISDKKPKRMRQSQKPLLNKLESEFRMIRLPQLYAASTRITSQSMRVKISASSWYKVDFFLPSVMHAHEVKGPRVMKNQQSRQMLALKVAAAQWPEIEWFLNWYEDGQWWQQKVNAE